jgi:hypothetical protein
VFKLVKKMMALNKDAPGSRFMNWLRAWQDVLFVAMILASLLGLIYVFTRK